MNRTLVVALTLHTKGDGLYQWIKGWENTQTVNSFSVFR